MKKRVIVIDYGSGNLRSVFKALESVCSALSDVELIVSSSAKDIANASHIILPGVGAFADCRAGLFDLPGMHEAIDRAVLEEKRWFLGICVGMQLLADIGFEHGAHSGLRWIHGAVKAIPEDLQLKIPHMGWNNVTFKNPDNVLFEGIENNTDMYFVHSYYFVPEDKKNVIATTHYGIDIPAIIAKENITGVQFHPEKSQKAGLQFLANFMRRTK